MGMLDVVKKAALAADENSAPVALLYANVVSTGPLRVFVDNRFELPESFLAVPQHIGPLAQGDKLALLRNRGGNEFFVLGKVADNG